MKFDDLPEEVKLKWKLAKKDWTRDHLEIESKKIVFVKHCSILNTKKRLLVTVLFKKCSQNLAYFNRYLISLFSEFILRCQIISTTNFPNFPYSRWKDIKRLLAARWHLWFQKVSFLFNFIFTKVKHSS